MNRFIRNLLSFALTLSIIFLNVSANENPPKNTFPPEPETEVTRFEKYISTFFENPIAWRVIDFNGNDIPQ